QLELQMKMNRLGGKIVEMKKVYKSFGDKIILKGFDYTFSKGERIGVVGKNGAGKSTFINMIQQLEKPDSGKINIGDTVIFGNYSQQGLVVKEDKRVIEFVKDIAEHFPLAGGGSLSAAQFLQLFLFDPDKQYTYISKLSGGEKRRLHLLSILFRNPNFLVLDEPTNDLDLPTLSILENFLSEFPGCLLIVSHDRYFMDRLVDHLFVFEGEGIVRDYPGNYSQYRLALKEEGIMPDDRSLLTEKTIPAKQEPLQEVLVSTEKKRFSFKEKREYETLEKEIAALTKERELITGKLGSGETPFDELQKLSTRIGSLEKELDEKELRWLELSEMM
ncbi:MAG TPA: ATP-binding cassette domain-containing protein, partial [Chlamydiales bacterium]|nr:ATP-binding cassette domain-containing protein [Chlamydiales bacterium]